eukprot:3976323-Karenia_brevis.AAC.2
MEEDLKVGGGFEGGGRSEGGEFVSVGRESGRGGSEGGEGARAEGEMENQSKGPAGKGLKNWRRGGTGAFCAGSHP